MKVLVTGGAGFIGSHIAERLVREGHTVKALDNLSSGKRENIAHLPEVELAVADVRDAPQLEWHMAGCDLVFHQAAIVSVPYSIDHPQETHDVNIQGTLNVLEAARRQRVKRVVFASSAAIYGDDPELPKKEKMRAEPISPYGIEKATGEQYLQVWSRLFGVETVAMRYFNVFGPRQDPSSAYSGVISIFVDRALRGAPITIFGDGTQCRDFVYVGNVVDANMLAATRPGVSGMAFNVGCGQRTTLSALVQMIARILGREIHASHGEARAGDIWESVADISLAREKLGYDPKVGVEEGLAHLIEWVKSQERS